MADPIRFYFDYISPFTYLAWGQVRELASRHERTLEAVPVLFAGLLNHYGQLGPAEVEPKRIFTFKTVIRRAARMGLPVAAPPHHPFNPLLGLRVTQASESDPRVITRLLDAVWARSEGIEDPAAVRGMLDEIGVDGQALVEAAATPEVKGAIKTNTAKAIEAGVFGVPTTIVGSELFWGSDVFEDLDAHLRGADPVDQLPVADWENLRPSAVRPGSKR